MIYFFDPAGRCVFSDTAVTHRTRHRALIDRHLANLAHKGVADWFVSEIRYPIGDVYWEAGRLKQRLPLPCLLDTTNPRRPVFSRLPAPCTITINGRAYAIDESEIAFHLPLPTTYAVTVRCWPYLDATYTIAVP